MSSRSDFVFSTQGCVPGEEHSLSMGFMVTEAQPEMAASGWSDGWRVFRKTICAQILSAPGRHTANPAGLEAEG